MAEKKTQMGEIEGLKVVSVRTLWALGLRDLESYHLNFFHRLSQFLRVIWRSFPNSIFDLRIIFKPSINPSQGEIHFAILARSLLGETHLNRLHPLFHGFFEEYEAIPLNKEQIMFLAFPFPFPLRCPFAPEMSLGFTGREQPIFFISFWLSPLPFAFRKPKTFFDLGYERFFT